NVASNYERVVNIARAHVFNQRVHMPCLAAITNGQFVFSRRQAECANHHGAQCIRKLALEHRAFAGDYAVILAHFAKEKGRKCIRKIDLAGAFKISASAVEIESRHGKVCLVCAKNVAHLRKHLLDANVRAGVTRAVVACEENPQLFTRLPPPPKTKTPPTRPNSK